MSAQELGPIKLATIATHFLKIPCFHDHANSDTLMPVQMGMDVIERNGNESETVVVIHGLTFRVFWERSLLESKP